MSEVKLNNNDPKTIERCAECDREVNKYYTFVSPTNVKRHVCWECQMREEKGFNAKRDFKRRSRRGVIPR